MATDHDDAERVRPVRFDYNNRNRTLVVEWADGQVQELPFRVLRRSCPCAACHGEMGYAGRFATEPDLRPGEDELADIALVGSYALTAMWADGHNTGIFTYRHLRAIGDREIRAIADGESRA